MATTVQISSRGAQASWRAALAWTAVLTHCASPGATASLAIGDEIIRRLGDRLGTTPTAAAA